MLVTKRFLKEYLRVHLKTAMEYKLNFVLQVIFMMLNNTAFLVIWIVLFSKLDSINGWFLEDFLMIFGFAATCFGIISFYFGNWQELNEIISEGKLDFYLTLPKDVLLHSLISKSSFSAVGDIIFGVILILLTINFTLLNFLLVFFFILTGTIIFLSLMVLANSTAFLMGRNVGTIRAFTNLTLSMNTYPSILYGSVIKFTFFFIIPIFFITNSAIFVLKEFSWFWLIYTLLVTIILPFIAYFVFKKGLKKYESGNLMVVRF